MNAASKINGALLAAIALNGDSVTGQYLRHGGDDLHRPITDSTALKEGQSATCYEGEAKVYRWTEGKLRWYPNPEIANSHNPLWRKDVAHVDCQHLQFGHDMSMNIRDGEIVTCFNDEEKVYILEHKKLRWIPNPEIADSYNIRWRQEMKYIDCHSNQGQDFEFGDDMPLKMDHRTAQDGDIVTCFGHEEKVYFVQDGKLRWYPSPPLAYSWTKYWRPGIIVDCEIYHFGPDMPFHYET